MDQITKKCNKCGIVKNVSEFYKTIDNKVRGGVCISCQLISGSQYKKSPQGKKHALANRIKNKPKVLYKNARSRARIKNIEFNIELSDIVIPNICPVLGIPIFSNSTHFGPNSPSIDRIDNSKGYVKGNICVISWRANTLKNNGNIEDFKKIIEYMENHVSISRAKS